MDSARLPRSLSTVRQALPVDLAHSAVLGLGDAAQASREALERGLAPPDVLVGASLSLTAPQPRPPRVDGAKRKGAVSRGVWVREQVAFRHPVRRVLDDVLI